MPVAPLLEASPRLADVLSSRSCPEPNSGCLLWTGGVNEHGYGRLRVNGRDHYTHVIAWRLAHGAWPIQCVLHKCDTPACVNPDHLFEGSRSENNQDRTRKGREARGERNGAAHLTVDLVVAIRARAAEGESLTQIAADAGCSQATVSRVVSRRIWRHV